MPGLNGRALASKLLADNPNLRIVFITGYDVTGVHDREPGLALLKKPFDPDEMGCAVRKVLDGPSAADAA
jgi:FixJ family two-component response regulator